MSKPENPKSKPAWRLSAQELAAIGRTAGLRAVAESKARGLPVTGVRKGTVVREWPNGRREIVKRLTGHRT